MEIESGINPNCSEAVFRFYTLEPQKIQGILQALADEISANSGFEPHENQKIPLYPTAEDYDTHYQKVREDDYKKLMELHGDDYMKGLAQLHEKQYPEGSLLKC